MLWRCCFHFPSGQRYTFNCIFEPGRYARVAGVTGQGESGGKFATIAWEGDSREVLQSFPEAARKNLGFDLWRLQQGETPSDYRPLASIGAGVFELRDRDQRAWYRVVYLARIRDVIHVLHCFEKKSRQMARKDFEKARQRLKAVRTRLAQEKKI